MFATFGLAGLGLVQAISAHKERKKKSHRQAHRPLSGHDVLVAAAAAAAAARPLGHVLRPGVLVVLRDKRGQLMTAQPLGCGKTWELVPNCASGGALVLTHGESATGAVRSSD
jgi:hypothetical protein